VNYDECFARNFGQLGFKS